MHNRTWTSSSSGAKRASRLPFRTSSKDSFTTPAQLTTRTSSPNCERQDLQFVCLGGVFEAGPQCLEHLRGGSTFGEERARGGDARGEDDGHLEFVLGFGIAVAKPCAWDPVPPCWSRGRRSNRGCPSSSRGLFSKRLRRGRSSIARCRSLRSRFRGEECRAG